MNRKEAANEKVHETNDQGKKSNGLRQTRWRANEVSFEESDENEKKMSLLAEMFLKRKGDRGPRDECNEPEVKKKQ